MGRCAFNTTLAELKLFDEHRPRVTRSSQPCAEFCNTLRWDSRKTCDETKSQNRAIEIVASW